MCAHMCVYTCVCVGGCIWSQCILTWSIDSMWSQWMSCCWGWVSRVTIILCWWTCRMHSPFKETFEVSYKVNHSLTIWTSNHAPGHIPKLSENACPYKNLHAKFYNTIIHNSQNLEAMKMSFNSWICNQTVISTQENNIQQ